MLNSRLPTSTAVLTEFEPEVVPASGVVVTTVETPTIVVTVCFRVIVEVTGVGAAVSLIEDATFSRTRSTKMVCWGETVLVTVRGAFVTTTILVATRVMAGACSTGVD